MTQQPGVQVYTQGYGSSDLSVAFPVYLDSVPSSTYGVSFPIGKRAIIQSTNAEYVLTSKSTSSGVTTVTWTIAGSPTGAVATETGDTGTATPAAGNIVHAGTAGEITTAAAADTITYSLPAAITAPGSLTTTTTLVGGTGITATTGNITASTGDLISTLGAVSAATTVTAGTGVTATTGGVTATAGNITANDGDIITTRSDAGVNVTIQATNSDNTSGTSNAGVEIATGGASSGDPYLAFQISGVGASTMTMGLDNSASDIFVISNSGTLGTNNALTLTQTGELTASGNIILGSVATQLQMNGGAVTDFIGQATLALGTVTVANTNIAAGDRIFVTRSSLNGSTALGELVSTIVAATSFTITSVSVVDGSTTIVGDTSIVDYVIIRQN